jgi:magnesium and cobalt transporter
MVPRTDMVALDSNTDIHTVLKTIMEAGHSRIPVYEGDVDNIVGLLYAKDLLKVWGEPADKVVLGALLRRVYFIPESKTIADLLKDFKLRRVHMAVAVDEYGGTAGIVTIEDILEEIVGEIEDEYDSTEEKSFRRLDDGRYLFDARSHIEDVEEELNVEIPRGNYDTLGGFISFKLGHVPHKGEKMSYGKLLFTVVEADATKVSEIQITLTSEEE